MEISVIRAAWGSKLVEVVPDTFYHIPEWFNKDLADHFQAKIMEETLHLAPGQRVFGKKGPYFNKQKRMVRHGDSNVTYTYKGKAKPVYAWTPGLSDVRFLVTGTCMTQFNCVVTNYYMDGTADLYPHTDITYIPQLGPTPDIVSVTFGGTRDFLLVSMDKKTKLTVPLKHGDLFIMTGRSQLDWKHGIAPTSEPVAPRVSLTFRKHIIDGTTVASEG